MAAPRPPVDGLTPYHRTIRELSDRIVEAQRPIRILDACKWPEEVESRFFEKQGTELPQVTREDYRTRPLGFDADAKHQEFYAIERDIRRELGMINTCGALMLRTCKEYHVVLTLLESRGTRPSPPSRRGSTARPSIASMRATRPSATSRAR